MNQNELDEGSSHLSKKINWKNNFLASARKIGSQIAQRFKENDPLWRYGWWVSFLTWVLGVEKCDYWNFMTFYKSSQNIYDCKMINWGIFFLKTKLLVFNLAPIVYQTFRLWLSTLNFNIYYFCCGHDCREDGSFPKFMAGMNSSSYKSYYLTHSLTSLILLLGIPK